MQCLSWNLGVWGQLDGDGRAVNLQGRGHMPVGLSGSSCPSWQGLGNAPGGGGRGIQGSRWGSAGPGSQT